MFWKLAKVEELLPGRDGLVRAAIVKVVNSDKRPRLMRSVKHLYPIEVNAKDDEASGEIGHIVVQRLSQTFCENYSRSRTFIFCFCYIYVCSLGVKQPRGVSRKFRLSSFNQHLVNYTCAKDILHSRALIS